VRWISGLALLIALALPAPASAAEWLPGDGEQTEETRSGPDFRGMGFLFPLRLHLVRGGHLDGQIAGADEEGGELLFIPRPGYRLFIVYHLVTGVTPLGELPQPGSALADQRPPELATVDVVYRRRPTWRSGLGLALNLIAPGTGHFIQKDEKALGFLFLGLDAFFLAAGSLAAFAPSRLSDRERVFFGAVFFGVDLFTRGTAAGHAFEVGREREAVSIRGTSGPGLAP